MLLDVSLPDIDGIEICSIIKSNPLTANLSVVHMSATRIADHDRVHGLDNGADGYLTEPVGRDELVATLRARLRACSAEERGTRSRRTFAAAALDTRLSRYVGLRHQELACLQLDEHARGLFGGLDETETHRDTLVTRFEETDRPHLREKLDSPTSDGFDIDLRLARDGHKPTMWRVLRGRAYRSGNRLVRISGIIGDSTTRRPVARRN